MKRTLWLVCVGAMLGACSPTTGQRLECDDAGGCEVGYVCKSGRCAVRDDGGLSPPAPDGGPNDDGPPPHLGAQRIGRLVWTGGPLGESGWGAGVIMTTGPAGNAAGDQLHGRLVDE